MILRSLTGKLQLHNDPLSYQRSVAIIQGVCDTLKTSFFLLPWHFFGDYGFKLRDRHKIFKTQNCFEKANVFSLLPTLVSNLSSVLSFTLPSSFLSPFFLFNLMAKISSHQFLLSYPIAHKE